MLASEKYHNLNSSSKRRLIQTREGTKMNFSALKKFTKDLRGFPGGAVVENLPANAGHAGSSPGLGGSHMPRSN